MKNITLLLIFFSVLIVRNIEAQNLIAVQNGGNPSFYTKLDSALVHAQNGDTIYIPGGYYSCSIVNLSKQLHIIGVGHNPDSTTATVSTHITNGPLFIHPGAGGGSLTGVYWENSLWFYDNVSNYTVMRCNIYNLSFTANTASNNVFIENVIRLGLNCGNAQSSVFYNNVIEGGVSFTGENTVFKNNIFLLTGNYLLTGQNYFTTFENNIFLCFIFHNTYNYNGTYNIFNNNLFSDFNIAFPFIQNQSTSVGNNNIGNQPLNTVFINSNGGMFYYSHDYHLQPTCPGKNAGTDGTDIGIYGGPFPWKDGSVPFNPHIQSKYIDAATDPSGNLDVNIKVSAQDR